MLLLKLPLLRVKTKLKTHDYQDSYTTKSMIAFLDYLTLRVSEIHGVENLNKIYLTSQTAFRYLNFFVSYVQGVENYNKNYYLLICLHFRDTGC